MRKLQKIMSIICMTALLSCLMACGSSGGNRNEDGQPDTPETTVSPREETDSGSDTESLQETGNQSAETTEPADMEEEAGEETGKVLVAYFSATGTTKALAEYAADALGADLYEIVPEEPYTSDDLNYNDSGSRTSIEMNDPNSRPAISGSVENMEQYEIIFLGYPIWWGESPRIVSTFMESYDFSGKTIVPFCTSGGSGIGSSARNLQSLCAEDVTWLDGSRLSGSSSREDIVDWINGLGLDLEAE